MLSKQWTLGTANLELRQQAENHWKFLADLSNCPEKSIIVYLLGGPLASESLPEERPLSERHCIICNNDRQLVLKKSPHPKV